MVEDDDIVETHGSARRTILGIGPRRMERVRHALWSGLIALVMAVLLLLDPLDQILWLIQSRIDVAKPSGEIVFVQAHENVTDPDFPFRRSELARTLNKLREDGTKKVYLDLIFDHKSNIKDDEKLKKAIQEWGNNLIVVDRVERTLDRKRTIVRNIKDITGNQPRVIESTFPDYLGYAWWTRYGYSTKAGWLPSFEASLAETSSKSNKRFAINYNLVKGSIPSTSIASILKNKNGKNNDLRDKIIVIGASRNSNTAAALIPGQINSPPSYVAIFAAETLKSGGMEVISGIFVVLFLLFLILVNIITTKRRRDRNIGYTVISITPFVIAMAAIWDAWRIELAYSLPLLLTYSIFRSRARWKKRVALIDQDTGLPTIRALDSRLSGSADAGHVVVAKIHGYEKVIKTFASEDRAAYVLKLVDRLRATDSGLTVYVDGHNLAWHAPEENGSNLIEHLEGLRAIFAAPVAVGGHSVDVGITFGAADLAGDRTKALAAALAAAEETSEAHQPIKLAQSNSDQDILWDLSLRSRIDEAMKAGEIFCVYQPQMDIARNQLVGVEALVRWQDPVKGFISPLHFIMQCEKAGRMEHLTRYVLQSACSAGQLLHFRGHDITMSVNISATLLNDMRIVGIVRNVLQATGFSPSHLILEITETTKVGNLETAEVIIRQLKALGTKISMDDFGVGAANFEALHALPFDEVKIDRRFIADAARNPKARAIVSSIVAMGRESRITVVAEGAETAKDLQMLQIIGCSQVQGYALSKPISLTNLLEKYAIPPEAQKQNMV